MTITELPISQAVSRRLPYNWVLNITSDDASTAVVIRSAEPGKKHWIESLYVTSYEKEWFQILDGDDILIGPVTTSEGVPWRHTFRRDIHGSENSSLKLQTQSDSIIHLIVEGHTDTYTDLAYSPSPADKATGVDVDADLAWDASLVVTSYKVYFGTNPLPSTLVATTDTKTHVLGTLDPLTTYYWRIDTNGIAGDIWSFTTV